MVNSVEDVAEILIHADPKLAQINRYIEYTSDLLMTFMHEYEPARLPRYVSAVIDRNSNLFDGGSFLYFMTDWAVELGMLDPYSVEHRDILNNQLEFFFEGPQEILDMATTIMLITLTLNGKYGEAFDACQKINPKGFKDAPEKTENSDDEILPGHP